ncbi:hypothetical protein JX266_008919 [Neoarthrinium moseri]|nr:hypothetical protein JX266_008919 [Neoarthrinium moseri]
MRLGHYRRSCDRCHDQKLRCRRDDNEQSCQRCQRAKAKCTVSGVPQGPRAANSAFAGQGSVAVLSDADQEIAETMALASANTTDHRLPRTPKSHQGLLPDLAMGRQALGLDFSFADAPLHESDLSWDSMIHSAFPVGTSSESSIVSSVTNAQSNTMGMSTYGGGLGSMFHHKEFADGSLLAATTPQSLDMPSFSPPASDLASGRTAAAERNQAMISRGVRQLSDLSLELYSFASLMPPASAWDRPGEYSPLEGKEFALDRVLKISQLFIETLDRLFPKSHKNDDDVTVEPPSLDQPCQLIVLSSYLRIIEIYHNILEHVAACARLKRSTANSNPNSNSNSVPSNRFMHLPSLAIGSFTMESSTTTQVLVLVQVIEIMMTRSRYLIQFMVNAGKDGDATSMEGDSEQERRPTAGEASLEGLKSTENATLAMVEQVRGLLFELVLSRS